MDTTTHTWCKVADLDDLPPGRVHTVGKISKEQRAGHFDVWQAGLHNPNFAEYTRLCGAHGARVTDPDELDGALKGALAQHGPALVEIITDPELV